MLKFAIRNLLTRPVRSLLSLLGLTVAIVGMVGLFSVAEGLDALVRTTFSRVHGLIVIQPGVPIPLFSKLPQSWGKELAEMDGVEMVNDELWARAHVIEGESVISPPRFLFGTDINTRLKIKQGVYRDDVVSGRFLEPSDRGTLNAVVSRQIAEEHHKKVGDQLKVDGNMLNIVGIYHCGSLLLDIAILMDIGTVEKISRAGSGTVSCFYVDPKPDANRKELMARIKAHFRGRTLPAGGGLFGSATGGNPLQDAIRSLDAYIKGQPAPEPSPALPRTQHSLADSSNPELSDEPAVDVRSSEDWGQEFDKFSADLDLVLTLMTGIGVTIAVLSIINTMLMSVTERIIEFGILKANGWSNRAVLQLVTMESAALGLAGGICGSGLGWLATHVVNAQWPDRIHLYASPQLLIFGVVFSTALGIVGGMYPAMWASRMLPMDAIRRG